MEAFATIGPLGLKNDLRMAKRNPLTLEDVARKAGVSPATVSRALNTPSLVQPKTRARVLEAAETLRYRPNRMARELAGGRSRTVGLIVSNLANPFFLDIFHSVEYEAKRHGYEVLVENTGYEPMRLAAVVDSMIGRSPAGLVIVVSELEEPMMEELREGSIPVVVYDVGAPGANISNIRVNEARGVKTLLKYLRSLGHERFGLIPHHSQYGSLRQRREMLIGELGDVLAIAPDVEDSLEGGRSGARFLLDSANAPTAILGLNDHLAIGALREAHERGLRVPEQLSVAGFDNIHWAEYVNPTLTTVNIPRDSIGRLAMERILTPAGAPTSARGQEIIVQPDLVIRDSTGPAPTRL